MHSKPKLVCPSSLFETMHIIALSQAPHEATLYDSLNDNFDIPGTVIGDMDLIRTQMMTHDVPEEGRYRIILYHDIFICTWFSFIPPTRKPRTRRRTLFPTKTAKIEDVCLSHCQAKGRFHSQFCSRDKEGSNYFQWNPNTRHARFWLGCVGLNKTGRWFLLFQNWCEGKQFLEVSADRRLLFVFHRNVIFLAIL